MQLQMFQIDSFTNTLFRGNPAAVCRLPVWLSDSLMQQIAAEMNLSETAFFVGSKGSYELRWFTPKVEIDLCGHATLACAWALANELGDCSDLLNFSTRSGELRVQRKGHLFSLDFPADAPVACAIPDGLREAFGGVVPEEILGAADYLVVFRSENEIVEIVPDFSLLSKIPKRGVIVTAPGTKCDFVSRWFGPKVGVLEDPVTGSAHTTLTPYWSGRLGKQMLSARQISARGGELECRLDGDRVHIVGFAVKFAESTIELKI